MTTPKTMADLARKWAPAPDASETEVRGALVRERAELVTLAQRCRADEDTLRARRLECLGRIDDIDRELNREPDHE